MAQMMLKVIDVLAQSGNRCPGSYQVGFKRSWKTCGSMGCKA